MPRSSLFYTFGVYVRDWRYRTPTIVNMAQTRKGAATTARPLATHKQTTNETRAQPLAHCREANAEQKTQNATPTRRSERAEKRTGNTKPAAPTHRIKMCTVQPRRRGLIVYISRVYGVRQVASKRQIDARVSAEGNRTNAAVAWPRGYCGRGRAPPLAADTPDAMAAVALGMPISLPPLRSVSASLSASAPRSLRPPPPSG